MGWVVGNMSGEGRGDWRFGGFDFGRIRLTDGIVVARAFQVLSDPDKKAKYDRFGGDPDSRFPGASAGGGGASPFSNFARAGGAQRGQMWEEEISPEDLFRQFFGGGFGGPFGMFPDIPWRSQSRG